MAKFLRAPFLQNTSRRLLLKFVQYLCLESFFVSLDKSVLLHRKCLMSKFSEILILVCRKTFSPFYQMFHETFSKSSGFPLMQEFNPFYPHLVLYDRKHFCSVLTDLSNLSFSFYQKCPLLSYDLKNVLTKQFPKMQKQPFTNVLQNRCSYKFPKSLFNAVRDLKTCNFNKKETPTTQVFSCEYHKIFKNSFFMEDLQALLLNMVEEFLRISNLSYNHSQNI